MNYWLLKSEPDVFGIDDLAARPQRTEPWDGVRNYQARNFMREMRKGDQCLFYHSNCRPPGVAGIMQVVRPAYPDPGAQDPQSPYFDPRSSTERPVWDMVDVQYVRHLPRFVTLAELQAAAATLGDLHLLRRGNRLSVMPVPAAAFRSIIEMANRPAR